MTCRARRGKRSHCVITLRSHPQMPQYLHLTPQCPHARLAPMAPLRAGVVLLLLALAGGVGALRGNLGLAAPRLNTFEEAVEASGLLDDRPPEDAGDSGHSFYTVQPMQLLSWYPRAYLWPKFMDKARCEHVIAMAERRLAPSGLALKRGDTAEATRDVRTSQGTFMSRQEDPGALGGSVVVVGGWHRGRARGLAQHRPRSLPPRTDVVAVRPLACPDGVLAWIEDKIAVLTGVPTGYGEPFNVLRYEQGQHYDSHFDAFDEAAYGKQPSQRVRAGCAARAHAPARCGTAARYEAGAAADAARAHPCVTLPSRLPPHPSCAAADCDRADLPERRRGGWRDCVPTGGR